MIIKENDKNEQVAEIQKMLSLIGYDLIINGFFCSKTERSVKSFQKKSGLPDTGIINDNTYEALKASQKRNSKEIKSSSDEHIYEGINITRRHISSNQFIKQVFDKTQIFIHHTEGGPNGDNAISRWNLDEPTISTAFVIDRRDGSIYEAFNPDYWSYHLGIKGTKGKLDKVSIGIELCNWGQLINKDGKFFNYLHKEISSDEVIEIVDKSKEIKYFEKYTEDQLKSLEDLLRILIKKFNISIQNTFDIDWFDYNKEVIDNCLPGIWSHRNVRQDKLDIYSDERLLFLLEKLALEFNK
jgi:N-acetyl-anhydromuramyl-L-alanine amidase AmpD